MNLSDKLKQAGYQVPDKISKLDAKEKNLRLKLDRAENQIQSLSRQLNDYDKNKNEDLACAISYRFNTFVEAFKDIINEICKLESSRGVDSYRSALRKFGSITNHSYRDIEDALIKFENRNSIIHEYLDEEYYFELLYMALINDIDKYQNAILIVDNYCISKGYVVKS